VGGWVALRGDKERWRLEQVRGGGRGRMRHRYTHRHTSRESGGVATVHCKLVFV